MEKNVTLAVETKPIKKGTYYKRKAAGVCVGCAKCPPKDGAVRCQDCTVKKRQDDLKYIELNTNRGQCIVCYVKIEGTEKKCENCLSLARKFSKNVYEKRRAAGDCVSCGKKKKPETKTMKCESCKEKEKRKRKLKNNNSNTINH